MQDSKVTTLPAIDISHQISQPPMTILQRLVAAEEKTVTPDKISDFVGKFFDDLKSKISINKFDDFFEIDILEHPNFNEPISQKFIIRILSKEKRPDNFVTAVYSRTLRSKNPVFGASIFDKYLDDDRYQEDWELSLNYDMEKSQLIFSFVPKFVNLQKIIMTISCAPSLDYCYIFEIATQHMLRDFGKFDHSGSEASRRWWKLGWAKSTSGVATQISDKLMEILQEQLESAEARLSQS